MDAGATQLPTAIPSRGTHPRGRAPLGFPYGAVTLYGPGLPPEFGYRGSGPSPRRGAAGHPPLISPRLSRGELVWATPLSVAPTRGIPWWFLFLPLLRCFRSGGSRGFSPRRGLFAPGRKSHSGIPGSTAACASPGLIAACHALRRRPSRAIQRAASAPLPLGRGPEGPEACGPWGHADPDRGPLSARASARAPLAP